jgi:hypothetical protein
MNNEEHFLMQLQELLTFGRFDSTYKFALLQALADISVETPVRKNEPIEILSSEIADKFIKYYWDHAIPFQGQKTLLQSTREQLLALKRITAARRDFGPSLIDFRRNEAAYNKLRTELAARIRDQPLKKLQRIRNEQKEFIYRRVNGSYLKIHLLPSAHRSMSRLYELVTAAIQRKWQLYVISVEHNKDVLGEQADLERFLFGQSRRSLGRFTTALFELQRGRCLYCRKPLRSKLHIDHFVPWSRYALDEGFNLVLAHSSCNADKKDHVPSVSHLDHWAENLGARGDQFVSRLEDDKLPVGERKTRSVISWAYSTAEKSDLDLWVAGKKFERCKPRWREVLQNLPFIAERS